MFSAFAENVNFRYAYPKTPTLLVSTSLITIAQRIPHHIVSRRRIPVHELSYPAISLLLVETQAMQLHRVSLPSRSDRVTFANIVCECGCSRVYRFCRFTYSLYSCCFGLGPIFSNTLSHPAPAPQQPESFSQITQSVCGWGARRRGGYPGTWKALPNGSNSSTS